MCLNTAINKADTVMPVNYKIAVASKRKELAQGAFRNVTLKQSICALLLIVSGSLNVPIVQSQIDNGSPCKPLVIAIEGGILSGGVGIRNLTRYLVPRIHGYVISVENLYLFSKPEFLPIPPYMFFIGYNSKVAAIFARKFSRLGLWPIVMIGHSVGGASAHAISSMIPVSLLVTLDAVSYPDNQPHPGNGARWINVYARNRLWVGNSIGEDWEFEPNADDNIGINTSHFKVETMFKRVENIVNDVLRTCTPNPHKRGGAKHQVYKNICSIYGIYCYPGEPATGVMVEIDHLGNSCGGWPDRC